MINSSSLSYGLKEIFLSIFRASHLRMKCHYRKTTTLNVTLVKMNKQRTFTLLICSRLNSISHACLHNYERRGTKQNSIIDQLSATCLVPVSPVFCPGLHKDDLSHIYVVLGHHQRLGDCFSVKTS